MMKLWIAVVLFVSMASVFAEMRIWTAKNGQTIEAEYQRDAGGKVWLKPPRGKVKSVPVTALSEADQNYIYARTLPKIEIFVDDDISRSTVGSDIDNVAEEMRFEIKVVKTSKNPFPLDYEIIFCAFSEDIAKKELILIDKKVDTFSLKKGSEVYSFFGKRLSFEYDPSPAWGTKYDGYVVCVKTADGRILATEGRGKYLESLHLLKDAKVNSRFDKRLTRKLR